MGKKMSIVEHLNLYFGYEGENMKHFIQDFKDEFEVEGDNDAVTSLLMFLNSYSKVEQ